MEIAGLEGKFIFNWARNCYESPAEVKVSGHKQTNVLAGPILTTLKKNRPVPATASGGTEPLSDSSVFQPNGWLSMYL